MEDKAKLRARFKASFPLDPNVRADDALKVCAHLSARPEFRKAARVALFSGLSHEVDLAPLWMETSKKFLLPRVEKDTLHFHVVPDRSLLSTGYHQIKEPPTTLPTVADWKKGDLILVPGIAFDAQGGRLGFGKGFYDRFLATLPPGVSIWGVCYDPQVSSTPLPMESFDVRMHALVTPKGWHSCDF